MREGHHGEKYAIQYYSPSSLSLRKYDKQIIALAVAHKQPFNLIPFHFPDIDDSILFHHPLS
jgi:hypothetical protein